MTLKHHEKILVAGAGLAGLSTAWHLRDQPHLLVEREEEAGGLCRSVRRDGFTFDHTGHLLHMKRPEMQALVGELLGEDAFLRIDRHSGVYSHGTYTDYPFQVNTHGLPRRVVRECVMGFASTLQRPSDLGKDPSFAAWSRATFGEGICHHFMTPYNEKLFCVDLESMTADWVSWSIPKPTWPEVVRGALGQSRKSFGYNPTFRYPAAGGIDHLPKAFLPHLPAPLLGTRVVRVRAERREAELSDGRCLDYSALISTIPLGNLLAMIEELPGALSEGARRLRHASVLNLNLGFDRPAEVPHHWVYFPEAAFPFYRVGVYSNLCPATVPPGKSSFYVEIAHPPGRPPEIGPLVERCASALRATGMVGKDARLVCVCPISIPFAYVVHDRARREFLPRAAAYLEERSILSVGRYGAWEYSAMEDALWHGRVAADWARRNV